jgi:hypothetical protein
MGASWRSQRSAACIIDTNAAPPDDPQRQAILIPGAITARRGHELARLSRLVSIGISTVGCAVSAPPLVNTPMPLIEVHWRPD